MICAHVPLLLKRNNGVLFGVLRSPRSDVPLFWLIMVLQLPVTAVEWSKA
jgi:hypothetical protein